MNKDLINKFIDIANKSKDLQFKEFEFIPSLDSLALDVWIALTPLERYEIMQQVEPSKKSNIYQKRCTDLIKTFLKQV